MFGSASTRTNPAARWLSCPGPQSPDPTPDARYRGSVSDKYAWHAWFKDTGFGGRAHSIRERVRGQSLQQFQISPSIGTHCVAGFDVRAPAHTEGRAHFRRSDQQFQVPFPLADAAGMKAVEAVDHRLGIGADRRGHA